MGGRDIDQKIVRWLLDEFKKQEGIDIGRDPLALQRLDEAAEKAKLELSSAGDTEINIPFITSGSDGPKHLLMKMSRAKLEELAREYIDKSIEITKRALAASPFKTDEINEIIMVGGQTRMPAIVQAVKDLFGGKEPNKSINPDEVVAVGAAIQAGIFQGDVKDITLVDVIPLSLGIETMGGVATKLIEKNTHIPTKKEQVFSTAADNQTSVEIHIVQGERPMAGDNKSLGRFVLEGIPPAPRGLPQVEVIFDVDTNGVLQVKAKDKSTGKEQSIRIEASSGLTEADIERMKQEAEVHSAEDAKKKELIDTRNLADQTIYTAEKALKDHGDKVSDATKTAVNDAIGDVRLKHTSEDVDAIKKATETLGSVMQKIGEEMAKQPETPQGSEAPQASEEAPVRDADIDDTKAA
jgi:molecular chaperone DnaK